MSSNQETDNQNSAATGNNDTNSHNQNNSRNKPTFASPHDRTFENVLNSIDTIKDDEDLKVKLRKQEENLILECVAGGFDGVFDILTDENLVGASKGVGRIIARALVTEYPKQQTHGM